MTPPVTAGSSNASNSPISDISKTKDDDSSVA